MGMESFSLFFIKYSVPLLIIVSGLVVGILAEKIVVRSLIRFSEKTNWKSDDILFKSLKNLVWPLFLVGGLYFALHNIHDLEPAVKTKGDSVISISLILLFTLYVSRILSRLVHFQTYDEEKQGTSTILTNLVRTVTVSVGIMIALQSLGISIQPLLTALGITGLAVALALQSTLSNFFSGLHIIASNRVRPGDYIRIDQDIEGYVSDINWRSTTIQQLSNNLIIIPNSKLADATVINTYLPDPNTSLGIECSVSYDSDLEKVEKVVLEVAQDAINSIDGCVPDPIPLMRFQSFGDSGIEFRVLIRINNFPDRYRIRHEFMKMLHKRFRQEKIEIPFPIRTIIMKDQTKKADA